MGELAFFSTVLEQLARTGLAFTLWLFLLVPYIRKPKKPNLVIIYVARPSPKMEVLMDLNSKLMSTENCKLQANLHWQTELSMLLSPEFSSLVGKKFTLINYSDLIKSRELDKLKALIDKL